MANPNDESLGGGATRMGGGNKPDERDQVSLGDQATFAGGRIHDTARSLGDAATLGGSGVDTQSDGLGDEMEMVDLSGRYTIESVLGKGGMGEVLLANDNRLKRKVAIKRVLGEMARSKTAVRRFLTEAQLVAALNHFNIVQIYDYGRDKDGPFVIMEYVDGSSLLDRCRAGAIPLDEAIEITCQLCDGLGRAHELGIIHRDIKPANVLMTKDGKPKLTDFGLAKQDTADHGQTMAGAVLGTLDFMPPEQRRDAALTDARSDLWSLAASLYQMVTGKSPKIIRFDLLPPSLTSVLGKALEESKEDRYQTAGELRAALQTVLQPVDTGEVELITGQCPSCGTKNEAGRKFCRKCAASLEVPCLSCNKAIQLWDEVCGQCGAQQGPLIEQRKTEMHDQQQRAEALRQDFLFDQAIQIATSLRDVPDLRLHQLKGWGERFLTDVQEDIIEQRQRSENILSEALAHEAAYDDNAGIRAIEKIPEPLRGEILTIAGKSISPHQLMKRLNQRKTKATQLEQTIQKRLKVRDLNGLLPQIEELLKYRPNREDVVQLKKQLEGRSRKLVETRDKALVEATELQKAQRYPEAIAALQAVDPSVETPQFIELRKNVEQKNNQVLQLREEIQQGVNSKQYDSLLDPVEELLSLVGIDEAMQKLRDQLLTRNKSVRAQVEQIVSQANALREKCQFRQASEALTKIPAARVTEDIRSLIDDCESLASNRYSTLPILKRAITEEKYAQAHQASVKYHSALSSSGIQDPEFQQLYQQCKYAVAEQKEAAEHLQASLRKTLFVGTAVGASVVVLAIGFWIYSTVRSSMRDKAIAAGIATQQWEAVLDLDSRNAQALLGRAGVRINQPQPDFDGAFKDLETAESIDIQAAGLKELKATAFAKRSESNANDGKIGEAQSDLQHAEKLGPSGASITESKKVLGQAYLKRGEASFRAKQISAAVQDAINALMYDPEIKLSESLLVASAENAIESFDRTSSDKSREDAVRTVTSLEQQYPNVPQLGRLKQRVGNNLLKVFSGYISAGDYEKAILDLAAASAFGADEDEIANLKATLVTALMARFRKSMTNQDYERAGIDFAMIFKLDASVVDEMKDALNNLPSEVLAQLPIQVLAKLPSELLAKLYAPFANSLGMAFKLIPGGRFRMGEGKDSRDVTLTHPYYLGVFEVTQEQYQRVMGKNPSSFKSVKNPVENVSWDDAVSFCKKLSELPAEKSAGRVYRLPTEAEWEYACRAGTTTDYSFDDAESQLDDYAWYSKNSGAATHAVGLKKPNAFGLYDMHGNVWEWCQDWLGDYPSGALIDPRGPSGGTGRVNRGGGWILGAAYCRSASRPPRGPTSRANCFGFRLALSPSVKQPEAEQGAQPLGVGTE